MFGLTDRGNKNKVNSAVWVMFLYYCNLHGYDLQGATNQWKTKTLVNNDKRELQRD